MSEHDWTRTAAQKIIADLSGRRGIKNEITRVDEETLKEITDTMAAIIGAASPQGSVEREAKPK